MTYHIRKIEKRDDLQVESIIRGCLIEFGGNRPGTAWEDPDLHRFSEIYNGEGKCYWVAEDAQGKILGGVGIGGLTEDICELQKMYCLPEARGIGLSHALMRIALEYARKYYKQCYLETLESMTAAHKFYEKWGFHRVYEPVVKTAHYSCEFLYLLDL